MQTYLDYLRGILENGARKDDRTGTGTRSVFGRQLRFDLQDGVPLLTTKSVWFKGVAVELLWFLSGGTNIRPLVRRSVSIWTDWPLADYREATGDDISQDEFEQRIIEDEAFAREWGALGPVYGKQWRDFNGADQIERLVNRLCAKPHSRRHLVSAWNPAELSAQRLPPCHYAFQCWVSPEGRLSLMWQQRSVDSFLGLPFNIASYALLAHLLAAQTGYDVGELIFSGGDCHIYENHIDPVKEQLTRSPRPLPSLRTERTPGAIFDYEYEDFALEGYDPHPAIRAPIAV
jgi:thymidylate synthase